MFIKNLLLRLRNRLIGRVSVDTLVKQGLQLGKNVSIGPDVIIDSSHCWLITIGDECTLTSGVIVLAHDASTKRHTGYTKIGAVSIGKRTFIGVGSIVLPGVTIGENVIIGAGSVVNRDIPDGTVAVGNPAAVIGKTEDFIERHTNNMQSKPIYKANGWTLGGGITEENKKLMREALTNTIGYVE